MTKQHSEKNFWKRTWKMHKRFSILGKIIIFPLFLFIIVLGHFGFAAMHYISKGYFLLIK